MKRLFESDRAWWMMITYCYGMLWAHNHAIIILYNMIHMISYNYQWKCWLETSCFTGVQPDARVPNFGSRVLINLREPWHQEGLERLTERMDCNEQARKDSFASHKQLNGSLKWVQDSRYFIIFTSNTTRIAQILCCMMLCWHLKLLWREVSVSAEHLELFHHKIAIDAPSEALRIDAHTRARCAGTGDLLHETFIYTSKTIPCCIMLSLLVFKREKERERELIYVAISATWVHLNFSSRSGKYSYLTKWKGLSPKGLLYRSGFTWLNKLYINL